MGPICVSLRGPPSTPEHLPLRPAPRPLGNQLSTACPARPGPQGTPPPSPSSCPVSFRWGDTPRVFLLRPPQDRPQCEAVRL